ESRGLVRGHDESAEQVAVDLRQRAVVHRQQLRARVAHTVIIVPAAETPTGGRGSAGGRQLRLGLGCWGAAPRAAAAAGGAWPAGAAAGPRRRMVGAAALSSMREPRAAASSAI